MPLALDLCAGKGGWSHGLLAAGWDVIGIDIEDMGGYPAQLVIADVRTFSVRRGAKIDLVVASPPCQEFSYRSFPFKRCRELAETVPPDESIWRACERIAKEVGAPLILENVRGAVKYMGKANSRYGPYYLWGDIPALIPCGKHVTKGFTNSNANNNFVGNSRPSFQEFAQHRDINQWKNRRGMVESRKSTFSSGEAAKTSSKLNARKEWSAKIAMIPFELSYYIGNYFKEKL